ncbi:MAG: alpha/beta hydrolase [Chitinophagaceae bacterium]|nr:alpha/beta hydrolase [Chitinophagaceae bacterium]
MNEYPLHHTIEVNQISLHVIEYPNDNPPMLLMHGLTANAHAFDGLIQTGLADDFHVYSVDLRGRGLSSKPLNAYSIAEHAQDIMGLLDVLHIDQIILCGHSFGGLLASYLAYHYTNRFLQVILLDAAPEMNPRSAEMLSAAIMRLDQSYPTFEEYLSSIRKAPYLTCWDEAMLSYYIADVETATDRSVKPRSRLQDIIQIAVAVSKEPWNLYFTQMKQKVILINALENYNLDMPLLLPEKAKSIVAEMQDAAYVSMSGNHQTMLYGKHAEELLKIIRIFTSPV